MSTNKTSDRDESLEMQNNVDRQAGISDGLGDRSSSGSNNPGRSGVSGGVNANDLRTPAFGATDPSLDENEADYGDSSGPQRTPVSLDGDTTDTPARNDGADRDPSEGSADSKGKADFMNLESEDDR